MKKQYKKVNRKKVEQKNEKNIISKCKLYLKKIINKVYKYENCDDFIGCENCNNKRKTTYI